MERLSTQIMLLPYRFIWATHWIMVTEAFKIVVTLLLKAYCIILLKGPQFL